MRIAIFTDSFWPQINGVTTSIWNMTQTLVEQGHHILIVAPRPDEITGAPEYKNVHIEWLPAKPLPTYKDYLIAHSFPKETKQTIFDFKPDIIHVHTPFYVAKRGVETAKKLNIPVVGTFHTLLSEFLDYLPFKQLKNNSFVQMLTWKYTQNFYNQCDIITTPTPILANELESHGFRDVNVLSNGIDYQLFSSAKKMESNANDKKIKLVYFGRISFEKRLDIAINALKIVHRKHPNVELYLVGSGPAEHALKQQASQLGISHFVVFTGPRSSEALAREVKDKDMVVAPSPMETQGLYVLEGMAAGLPAIGANRRAIPIAIGNDERGLLFDFDNFEDCAHKINQLIENPAQRKKLGKTAQKWVQRYDRAHIANEFVALYDKAIRSHTNP